MNAAGARAEVQLPKQGWLELLQVPDGTQTLCAGQAGVVWDLRGPCALLDRQPRRKPFGEYNGSVAPEPLSRFLGAVLAAGTGMLTLALSEHCTEEPASALTGDCRSTRCFVGEDARSGEDLCPNSQLSREGVFLF